MSSLVFSSLNSSVLVTGCASASENRAAILYDRRSRREEAIEVGGPQAAPGGTDAALGPCDQTQLARGLEGMLDGADAAPGTFGQGGVRGPCNAACGPVVCRVSSTSRPARARLP